MDPTLILHPPPLDRRQNIYYRNRRGKSLFFIGSDRHTAKLFAICKLNRLLTQNNFTVQFYDETIELRTDVSRKENGFWRNFFLMQCTYRFHYLPQQTAVIKYNYVSLKKNLITQTAEDLLTGNYKRIFFSPLVVKSAKYGYLGEFTSSFRSWRDFSDSKFGLGKILYGIIKIPNSVPSDRRETCFKELLCSVILKYYLDVLMTTTAAIIPH